MVHPSDLFNVNFYKKEVFYGSDRGMHYRLSREEVSAAPAGSPAAAEDGCAAPEANSGVSSNAQAPEEAPATRTVFRLITWPGPYNFAHTPEEKKKTKEFPFSNDALTEIADYLNAEHAAYYED